MYVLISYCTGPVSILCFNLVACHHISSKMHLFICMEAVCIGLLREFRTNSTQEIWKWLNKFKRWRQTWSRKKPVVINKQRVHSVWGLSVMNRLLEVSALSASRKPWQLKSTLSNARCTSLTSSLSLSSRSKQTYFHAERIKHDKSFGA